MNNEELEKEIEQKLGTYIEDGAGYQHGLEATKQFILSREEKLKTRMKERILAMKCIDQDDMGANYSISVDAYNDAINDILALDEAQEKEGV